MKVTIKPECAGHWHSTLGTLEAGKVYEIDFDPTPEGPFVPVPDAKRPVRAAEKGGD